MKTTSPTSPATEAGSSIHSDRRLPALTGLRIFAAVAVYLSHIRGPAGAPEVVTTFFESGYCGVTIFFVVSGFVLAYNYYEAMRKPRAAGIYNFLVARFARVYPLYLLVLLFIVMHLHLNGESVSGWWQHVLAIQTWNPDIFQAFGFNGPAWSVSVEFFLYACFPLLIPLVAMLRTPRAMLIAAAGVAAVILALAAWFEISGKGSLSPLDPSSAHRWLYRTPLTRIGDFLLGILAARLFMTSGHSALAQRAGRILTPLSILVIVGFMAWPGMFMSAWSWDAAYAIPAAFLLFGLAAAPATSPARFLSLPLIVLFGEASYAFYLVHDYGISFFGAAGIREDGSLMRIAFEAFVLGAILALAVGLHMIVELPARKFLRRWLSISEGSRLGNLSARWKRRPAEAPGS